MNRSTLSHPWYNISILPHRSAYLWSARLSAVHQGNMEARDNTFLHATRLSGWLGPLQWNSSTLDWDKLKRKRPPHALWDCQLLLWSKQTSIGLSPGKCFTGSHRLSVNDLGDGKIITFINFNLRSFKHLRVAVERLEDIITDRPAWHDPSKYSGLNVR